MTRLGKRRRAKEDDGLSDDKYRCQSTSPPERREIRPVDEKERQEWQGFCEIESDPVSVSTYDTTSAAIHIQELNLIFYSFRPFSMLCSESLELKVSRFKRFLD